MHLCAGQSGRRQGHPLGNPLRLKTGYCGKTAKWKVQQVLPIHCPACLPMPGEKASIPRSSGRGPLGRCIARAGRGTPQRGPRFWGGSFSTGKPGQEDNSILHRAKGFLHKGFRPLGYPKSPPICAAKSPWQRPQQRGIDRPVYPGSPTGG